MHQLQDLPKAELRRGVIGAIAALRQRQPRQTLFEYRALLVRAAQELRRPEAVWAAQNQTTFDTQPIGTPIPEPNEHPDNPRLLAAVWSLIVDGTLIPRFHTAGAALNNGREAVAISHLTLTPFGEAVMQNASDHPRFSGALSRLAERHPAMQPELTARLEDAVMCIDGGLARPAIVMVGLAMECALGDVAKRLSQDAKLSAKSSSRSPSAMERLADVSHACEQWYNGEDAHKLRFACGHAEMIRDRRNGAAHDPVQAFSLDEADQLLVLAVGALDSFYSIVVEAR